jgi:hypothetical protein
MSVPIISGLPAVACTEPGCICRGVFADVLGQLKCPHCHAHLSPSGDCLNLCGLTVPQYFQFQGMLAEAVVAVGWQGEPSEIGNADPVKGRKPV